MILNFAFMLSISLIINVFGISRYLTVNGINYNALMILCFIWGLSGSIFSLLLSKPIAKLTMGVKKVDKSSRLYIMVENLSKSAGIKTPEVGIYKSSELNAFATGWSRNRSLIAVSSQMVNSFSDDELYGVLGHEVAHVANGDMVTMALVQGLVNSFVMFFSRFLAYVVSGLFYRDRNRKSFLNVVLVFFFEIILGFFGMMITSYYSRRREYRADSDGARLAGKTKMIKALEALKTTGETHYEKKMAAFKINSQNKFKIMYIFSTHPRLDERIKKLKENS